MKYILVLCFLVVASASVNASPLDGPPQGPKCGYGMKCK